MTRRLRAVAGAAFLLPALLAAAAVAAPVALAGDPCFHGYTIPASTTAATDAVDMQACAFVPTNIRVEPGTTVTFRNGSEFNHLLTGANQAWGDREKEIPPGASVSMTFDTPGVYAFSCALHRGMSGAVIVGDADQDAAAVSAAGTTAGGTAGGGDALLMPAAITGLVVLAVVGWGAAWLERRRLAGARGSSTAA